MFWPRSIQPAGTLFASGRWSATQHLIIYYGMVMKIRKLFFSLTLLALSLPAYPASKEIVQLQTQVQALQDQMARMQQSFDERMSVRKNLVEQTTDSVNKMGTSVNGLQNNLQQQNTASGTKVDQVSTQVQSLQDAVDELKGRLAKV